MSQHAEVSHSKVVMSLQALRGSSGSDWILGVVGVRLSGRQSERDLVAEDAIPWGVKPGSWFWSV